MENKIVFDPNDAEGMIQLMAEYGDSEFPFEGVNDDGEQVLISISKDNITVVTTQKNGWYRTNSYTVVDGDEIISEESYEKGV